MSRADTHRWQPGPAREPSLGLRSITDADRPFVDWLQSQIAASSDQQLLYRQLELGTLTALAQHDHPFLLRAPRFIRRATEVQDPIRNTESKVTVTQQANDYIHSEGFAERIANWEPWRLDERSVRNGTNFYLMSFWEDQNMILPEHTMKALMDMQEQIFIIF